MSAARGGIRCLIFGYGYMGKIRHQALKKCPDVGSITIVDPYLDVENQNKEGSFLSAGDAISWENTDAVFICTPNNVTADLCIEGLKKCGRVFCEKPPGRNWDDFCRITEAAAVVPQHTLVFGFNHRLHPSIQAAKTFIGTGGLGDILYIKGTYGKSGGVRYKESWRNKPEVSGGGILLDQGIHMLDLFHLFLGPMNVMESVLTDSFWNCQVEDNAFLLLRSEKEGIPVFLHSSATLWKHTFRLEIGCRDGYLIAIGLLSQTGSYGREQLIVGRRQFEDEALALGNPREEVIHFDRDDSWDKEVQEFIAAVRENRSATHGTLEEARRVMQIIRDVYSMNHRHAVEGRG